MTATARKLPRSEILPLAEIEEDPNQPRKRFDEASLEELATNIEDTAGGAEKPWLEGLLHPVVVYPSPGWAEGSDAPRYRLLVGARRLKAYRLRAWPEIPARVVESPLSEARSIFTQLNENRGREDTSLLEEALAVERAFAAWKTEHPRGKTKDFAQQFNRSPSSVSRHLAVARAKGLALQALKEERINHVEAYRLFARLPIEAQRKLLARARRRKLVITARMARAELRPLGMEGKARNEKEARSGGSAGKESAPSRAGGGGEERPGSPSSSAKRASPRGPVEVRLTYAELRCLLTALGTPPPVPDAELEPAFLTALERRAAAA